MRAVLLGPGPMRGGSWAGDDARGTPGRARCSWADGAVCFRGGAEAYLSVAESRDVIQPWRRAGAARWAG